MWVRRTLKEEDGARKVIEALKQFFSRNHIQVSQSGRGYLGFDGQLYPDRAMAMDMSKFFVDGIYAQMSGFDGYRKDYVETRKKMESTSTSWEKIRSDLKRRNRKN